MHPSAFTYQHGYPVRVLRGVPVDDGFSYGGAGEEDQELDWTNPTQVGQVYQSCPIAPESSLEIPEPGAPLVLVDQLQVFMPYGVDVSNRDRVEVLSGPYQGIHEVTGTPAHWQSPYSGRTPGCVVRLGKRVGG